MGKSSRCGPGVSWAAFLAVTLSCGVAAPRACAQQGPAATPAARDAPSSAIPDAGKAWDVPYGLTDMQHVYVRAKIGGRGPFTFIVDTGAPMVVLSTAIARTLGVAPDASGWGTIRSLELEGGLEAADVPCMVADAYQVEGMNQLGLAGVELHGILGYAFLARYRIVLDHARAKMHWTRLDFTPPVPHRLESLPATLEVMSAMVKVAASLAGGILPPTVVPRGSLGIEIEDVPGGGGVRVVRVLEGSPAERAGLRAGDALEMLDGIAIPSAAALVRRGAQLVPGATATFQVMSRGAMRKVVLRASMGF